MIHLNLNELIDRVFGHQPFQAENIPINTAIPTPFNADCHRINASILERIEGAVRTYQSVDTVITDYEAEAANYPEEFFNSLTPPSFPQHELTLKVGTIVMLLRNLNVKVNLCNGTRLIVRDLGQYHIEAEIINFDARLSDKRMLLPQIDFVSGNSPLPFVMRRRQFPLRLSYCMTINKSQGS
ncbi:uncharacterized protein LOC123005280 [Tribolium madens]|uniref:uncharacterized protein LOC123005280 n=1 Tax=Tribolium madens TaxID=41895 RepID=UPI001CF76027|nr:uncharacterized protein LOC123005280 [Tribolium madens]